MPLRPKRRRKVESDTARLAAMAAMVQFRPGLARNSRAPAPASTDRTGETEANGIVRDEAGRRIVVVALGADFKGGDLYEIPDGRSARRLTCGPHGILDGLADGRMVISDWRSVDPPAPGRVSIHAPMGRCAMR